MIKIKDHFRTAMQQIASSMQQRADGLILPPDYIAGRHFGGFDGYEPWVQDCIRAACLYTRGVPQEELARTTAWVMWQPVEAGGPQPVFGKHEQVMTAMDEFAERVTGGQRGLTDKIREQITRVENKREMGTLMVIAMNPVACENDPKGELKASVSAWRPADIDEAKAVPKQEYDVGRYMRGS